jgi:hypothetical protein
MLNHDAPTTTTGSKLMDRERAVGKALEPHGLTLVIFPAGQYGVARPGDPDAVTGRFLNITAVELFTAALPAGPPPEEEQEWRETCPRCWHPFTALTESELLRRLLDHITYEHLIPARHAEADGDEPDYRGMIRIEWPPPNQAAAALRVVSGRGTAITDAVTGEPITTVSHADITIRADAADRVTAELVMFADLDGEPLPRGLPAPDGDGFRQGTFTFAVAEMRVQETPAP